jgi:hypothetical protein
MPFDRTWIIVGVVAIILASIVAAWLGIEIALGADVDQSCMTHEQAKAKWPTSYLYWRTARHCWYAGPGHTATAMRHPASPKPVPEQPAPSIDMPESPTIVYPALMRGGGTDVAMLTPYPMTTGPLLLDIDDLPQFEPWTKRITFD